MAMWDIIWLAHQFKEFQKELRKTIIYYRK